MSLKITHNTIEKSHNRLLLVQKMVVNCSRVFTCDSKSCSHTTSLLAEYFPACVLQGFATWVIQYAKKKEKKDDKGTSAPELV